MFTLKYCSCHISKYPVITHDMGKAANVANLVLGHFHAKFGHFLNSHIVKEIIKDSFDFCVVPSSTLKTLLFFSLSIYHIYLLIDSYNVFLCNKIFSLERTPTKDQCHHLILYFFVSTEAVIKFALHNH